MPEHTSCRRPATTARPPTSAAPRRQGRPRPARRPLRHPRGRPAAAGQDRAAGQGRRQPAIERLRRSQGLHILGGDPRALPRPAGDRHDLARRPPARGRRRAPAGRGLHLPARDDYLDARSLKLQIDAILARRERPPHRRRAVLLGRDRGDGLAAPPPDDPRPRSPADHHPGRDRHRQEPGRPRVHPPALAATRPVRRRRPLDLADRPDGRAPVRRGQGRVHRRDRRARAC
jgi:hypothetical protein